MENSETYKSAKKRVQAKMGFYTHLSVFMAVMLLLVALNLVTSPGVIWFHWPMLGWGIGVVMHALAVFIFPGPFAITEQMIEKEMHKSNAQSKG